MSTTLTMDDYLGPLLRAGAKGEFDAWLRRVGIAEMSCFEITFGEGSCDCRCYVRDESGYLVYRADAPQGFCTNNTPEYTALDFVEQQVIEVVPSEPPPASVLQYLAQRDQ